MNTIHSSARIADGVELGCNNIIGENVVIGGFRDGNYRIQIGDRNIIHDNVRILMKTFFMGNSNVLHNRVSIIAGHVRIWNNCWIGQYTMLDGTRCLTIGEDVTIGYNCYVWTHADRPGIPEGCLLRGGRPVYLMDGVWLMGCNVVVNPGVAMQQKSIALANSVITKDTMPGRVYGGVPAIELDIKAWE